MIGSIGQPVCDRSAIDIGWGGRVFIFCFWMGAGFLDEPAPTSLRMGFERPTHMRSIVDRYRLGRTGFYFLFLDGDMIFG
jgi:hypothetical protein